MFDYLPFNKSIALYPAPVRIGLFLLILVLFWLPVATPIYLLLKHDPNLTSILTMGFLFIDFLILLPYWSKKVHQNLQGLQVYGLVWSRKNGIELLNGLSIGLLFTFGLFVLESLLGWVSFNSPSPTFWRFVFEGLAVALGVGFAEELLFRGWILDELQRDYSPKVALLGNAVFFASLHFIKPISEVLRTFPQFPALVILGLTLVWTKWSCGGRLGMSIGLHGGLVWGYYILKVGGLIEYTNKAHPWITGIDDNPLQGIMGILFLCILAGFMRSRYNKSLK